jgi:basic amino acid/polyamine antiporter, APA family
VLAVTAVLCIGMRESARTNTVMVFIKLAVLALFLALGVTAFHSGNLHPFAPNGLDGTVTAASVIFFAYIGFDAVSTSGEETKNPGIGTLFAFIVVNIGVIILRRTKPDLERGFRVPWVPVFPIIGTLLCLYLMRYLSAATWIRFGVWLAIGLVIYFAYGIRHSRLRRGEVVNPEAELEGAS